MISIGANAFRGKYVSARAVFAHEVMEAKYGRFIPGHSKYLNPFREAIVDVAASMKFRDILSKNEVKGLWENAFARIFK
jgi:hypothetical protein